MRSGLLSAMTIFFAGAAHAGPLPAWSYTTTFAGDRGHEHLYTGFGSRFDSYAPDGMRYYTGYATIAAVPGDGSLAGPATVRVGAGGTSTGFIWDHSPSPYIDPSELDTHFHASLTITDESSGESATFSAVGTAGSSDSYRGLPVSFSVSPDGPVEYTLGDHRYRVDWWEVRYDWREARDHPERAWEESFVLADVHALPATPEPATLTLAALGLVSVAGLRFHRIGRPGGRSVHSS